MSECILLAGPHWSRLLPTQIQFLGTGEDWRFVISPSGAEALTCLVQQPFDAVVADADLPDMSGVDLLEVVLHFYPRSLRFLHAPLASGAARVKWVGIPHQLLAKPSAPETVHLALQRAFSSRPWMPGGALHRLLSGLGKLPSPPELYFQVVKAIESPSASTESVGLLVARDPVITAKLLQLANSVAFGRQQPLSEGVQAVVYLGLETTKSLILLAHTFAYFDQFKGSSLNLEQALDRFAGGRPPGPAGGRTGGRAPRSAGAGLHGGPAPRFGQTGAGGQLPGAFCPGPAHGPRKAAPPVAG